MFSCESVFVSLFCAEKAILSVRHDREEHAEAGKAFPPHLSNGILKKNFSLGDYRDEKRKSSSSFHLDHSKCHHSN